MTLSDYELMVLRELEKGRSSREIAKKLGLPEPIVKIAIEKAKGKNLPKKKIEFTKASIVLLVDTIILYLLLKLLIEVVKWFF